MQPIEIEITHKDFTKHKILAYGITPTIAVHERVSLERDGTYSITHVPSGARFNSLLMYDGLTREVALPLADYIATLIGEIDNNNYKDAAKLMIEKCPDLKDKVRAKVIELEIKESESKTKSDS